MLQLNSACDNTDILQNYLDSQNHDASEGAQLSENDRISAAFTASAFNQGRVVDGIPRAPKKKKKPTPLSTANREIFRARFSASHQRYILGMNNPLDLNKAVDHQLYQLNAKENVYKV